MAYAGDPLGLALGTFLLAVAPCIPKLSFGIPPFWGHDATNYFESDEEDCIGDIGAPPPAFLAFHAARCHKRTIELIDRIYHVIFTCSFPARDSWGTRFLMGRNVKKVTIIPIGFPSVVFLSHMPVSRRKSRMALERVSLLKDDSLISTRPCSKPMPTVMGIILLDSLFLHLPGEGC